MKINGVIIKKVALCVFLAVGSMHAKDKRVKSADAFDLMLARAPYSVVLFYDRSRDNMRDPETRNMITSLESMFRSLSKTPDYEEAELQFLRVDVSRRDMDTVSERFGVKSYPTVLLFLDRQPLVQRLSGTVYREQLQQLIEENLKEKMNEIKQGKQEQRKRALERARIRAYQWGGPFWYGGYYPYWHSGYYPYWWYGRGPYYGFHFGF